MQERSYAAVNGRGRVVSLHARSDSCVLLDPRAELGGVRGGRWTDGQVLEEGVRVFTRDAALTL